MGASILDNLFDNLSNLMNEKRRLSQTDDRSLSFKERSFSKIRVRPLSSNDDHLISVLRGQNLYDSQVISIFRGRPLFTIIFLRVLQLFEGQTGASQIDSLFGCPILTSELMKSNFIIQNSASGKSGDEFYSRIVNFHQIPGA